MRAAVALLLIAAISGCMAADEGPQEQDLLLQWTNKASLPITATLEVGLEQDEPLRWSQQLSADERAHWTTELPLGASEYRISWTDLLGTEVGRHEGTLPTCWELDLDAFLIVTSGPDSSLDVKDSGCTEA